ncbi:MAG: LPS export ABC transporter periplasmic protein LptC [Pyrinomonadaceae bacterium]
MTQKSVKQIRGLKFRAKLPQYFRFGAIIALVLTILAIGVAFYREKNKSEFRLKSEHTQLSSDVVAEVNGYERLESDGELKKYYIKADRAVTYSDNHQEMHNIYLEVFDETGTNSDKLTAARALYIPEEEKNFTAYLAGDVNIETRDALKVKTEHITYTKVNETAEADEHVEFERGSIKGSSFGAIVKILDKRLELLRDVQIDTYESPELAESGVRQAKINSGYAVIDQISETIELQRGVTVNISSDGSAVGRATDVNSDRATLFFSDPDSEPPQLQKLELFDKVQIVSSDGDEAPTKIASGYAVYDKIADRFDLKKGVHIITADDSNPANVRSDNAVYEQSKGKIYLTGFAEITQGGDLISGDKIDADLFPNRKLKFAVALGNAFLRQRSADRTIEISSSELNASFTGTQDLASANAIGAGKAVLVPANATEYSRVSLSASKSINVLFRGAGLLEKMETQGRTTIRLEVPNNSGDAANKSVTADKIRTIFGAAGKDLQRAEAIGNAELIVDPITASEQNYKTTVTASRFDCDFFPTGNNARLCIGSTKTKTVRVPTVALNSHGTQSISSDKISASFSEKTRDVERFDADGNAKFSERDRNAIASSIVFTVADETVRLRGAQPTVWDSKARAKAEEIDWDTRNDRSTLRGGVSTTYYSQRQTDGAAPFADASKPVFLTAEAAEFDHRAENATYTGNARGWQENNYVRAEIFVIHQKEGRFDAEGKVQSMLYNVKQTENGGRKPVFVTAGKMQYDRDTRLLRYESDVDIRQGTDRITANAANILLDPQNEVTQTVVESNVVITQPNRKASGDYAQFTAADARVVLRGNPARVSDSENGSSEGGELVVFLRENRVIGQGRTKQNSSGRLRSVYKVKTDQ